MVRRRASDAGNETAIGCHAFRTSGITYYLTNGGRIEVAQRMMGHSNAKTTGLYDWRNDDIRVAEVEDWNLKKRLDLKFSTAVLLPVLIKSGTRLLTVTSRGLGCSSPLLGFLVHYSLTSILIPGNSE
jgi:hypothetical protein